MWKMFAEIVELYEETEEDEVINTDSAYIAYDMVEAERIYFTKSPGTKVRGTKYYLNKKYIIKDNQRVFEKKRFFIFPITQQKNLATGFILIGLTEKNIL